jgi:CheY-like chemotaxis protein
MSRILLVDDSPHAQRMGERILSDEGYEVVTVSNADSALIRLDDVDPDVVLADAVMPGRTGYEICQYLKMSPRHRFVRVVLTAGVLEAFDEERARRVEADGAVKKPFEASALLATVKPLAEAAAKARGDAAPGAGDAAPLRAKAEVPFVAVVDAEQVHAAVTVALDACMQPMVDQITRRVLAALRSANTEPRLGESRVPALPREPAAAAFSVPELRVPEPRLDQPRVPALPREPAAAAFGVPELRVPEPRLDQPRVPVLPREPAAAASDVPEPRAPELPEPAAAASSGPEPPVRGPHPSEAPGPAVAPAPRVEPVRRVTPLRIRTGSILGLDIGEPEPPTPDPE